MDLPYFISDFHIKLQKAILLDSRLSGQARSRFEDFLRKGSNFDVSPAVFVAAEHGYIGLKMDWTWGYTPQMAFVFYDRIDDKPFV